MAFEPRYTATSLNRTFEVLKFQGQDLYTHSDGSESHL